MLIVLKLQAMEDRAKVLLVTGSVLLLLLAIVSAVIFYFMRGFQNKKIANTQNKNNLPQTQATSSAKPQTSPSPKHSPAPSAAVTSEKTYQGEGFVIFYPASWGLLTCSNSKNIEFDPTNATDFKNVKCDRAKKPVTILTDTTSCLGDNINLGDIQVTRSKISVRGYTKYRWCLSKPALDITHRVSNDNSPATSREDFSKQVEEMISRIRFGQGS